MARLSRIDVPGLPQHVIVRGNNRTLLFRAEFDRRVFMRYLSDAAGDHGCEVHAYVLMDNHVHLLATARSSGAMPRMMQQLGGKYARFVNAAHERTGTLFEGRYHASIVDTDEYLFACMRYIESNPVRAAMVADPVLFPWSSHRSNAFGERSDALTPREEYLALGKDAVDRAQAYRALFSAALGDRQVQSIRTAIQTGRPLGSDRFMTRLEAETGRMLRKRPPGRAPRQVKYEPDPN